MVATYFRGRLGNNMYQYSYIRSVSERNRYDYSIIPIDMKCFDQFDSIFPHLKYNKMGDENFLSRRKIPMGDYTKQHYGKYDYIWEEYNYDFKPQFYNLPDNSITFGFFQNYQYFKRSDVKNWFQIELYGEEKKEYEGLLNLYDPDNYCYIHFRGTDFFGIPKFIDSVEYWKNAKKNDF